MTEPHSRAPHHDHTASPGHRMVITASTHAETTFGCPVAGCGRRVRLDRRTQRLVVVHPGHSGVLHRGGAARTPTRTTAA